MSSENVKAEAAATEQEAPAAEEAKTETAAAEETEKETAEETKPETAAEEETKPETAAAETEETNMADAVPQEEKVAAPEETAPAEEAAAPAAEETKTEEAPAAEEPKAEETPAAPAEDAPGDAAVEAAPEAAEQAEAAADGEAEPEEELPEIPEGVMGAQTMPMGDKKPAPPSRLFYMDFVPEMTQAGNKKNKVHSKFEGFKQVFAKINQWLLNNPFKVLSVENFLRTVDYDGNVAADETVFTNKDMDSANYLCCTRVWLMIKPKSDTSAADSLGYYVHKPMPAGGVSELEQVLNLPTTVDMLNAEVKNSVIPGRIISVQTVEQAVGSDFSPSQMLSGEFGDDTYLPCCDKFRSVTIVRVIYAEGDACNEEIGVADFAPDVIKTPSAGTGKVFFTPFSELLKRANEWITANDAKTLRVVNVQIPTIRIVDITPKMAAVKKAGGQVDTKVMWHEDSRNFPTSHLKLVRVFYVKLSSPEEREPLALTTKLIVAPRKNQQAGEPLSNVVGRTNAWLHLTGTTNSVFSANIVSFEYTAAANTVDAEELCWLQDKKLRTFIQVILLFIHGTYTEPQKRLLPPAKYAVTPVDKSLKLDSKPKSSTCTVL